MKIEYRGRVIPFRSSNPFYPVVNLVDGHVLSRTKDKAHLKDTGKALGKTLTASAYFDIYAYSEKYRRLTYQVLRLYQVETNGGRFEKVYSCYWQSGSRVRTETGENSYEWWQKQDVNHNRFKATGEICDLKTVINVLSRSEIKTNAKAWPQLVTEWEKGNIRPDRPNWKKRGFGCEFEFTGITRKQAVDTLIRTGFFKFSRYVGGPLFTYELYDHRNRKFEIVRDSSIKARNKESQVEFVTAILSFDDVKMLEKMLKALGQAGGKVNSSCGMHVHVTADDYKNGYMFRNLVLWSYGYQKMLYKAFNVPANRQSYCRTSDAETVDLFEKTDQHLSIKRVADIQYRKHTNRKSHYNKSRYQILNIHSYFQGKGIEIRLFNGTLNSEQAIANIIFSCALVEHAAASKVLANIDCIEKGNAKQAMLFLLQEIDARSDHLIKMVDKNM